MRKEGADSKVIPLPVKKKELKGGVMLDKPAQELSKKECIWYINSIIPIDKNVETQLEIPSKLFLLRGEPEEYVSFSSNSNESKSGIVPHLILEAQAPKTYPEYGLYVHSRSNSLFCILVDKKRKVIVFDVLKGNLYDEGSWDSFVNSLNKALDEVKLFTSRGEKFDFVLNNRGNISAI